MFKRILSSLTVVVIMLGIGTLLPEKYYSDIIKPIVSEAAGTAYASIADEKNKFPQGKYWNHKVNSNSELANNIWHTSNAFADTTTDKPCFTHNGNPPIGQIDCNAFNGGLQCCGFARKLYYDIYHEYSLGAPIGNKNTIKAGDVLQYFGGGASSDSGHWVFVTSRDGNDIYVGECNWGGNCIISWGRKLNLNNITINKVESAPFEAPQTSRPIGTPMTQGAGQTIQDGDYWIISALAHNYWVDIWGIELAGTGANVCMDINDDVSAVPLKTDVFTFKYMNDGFYKITLKGTNVCLDVLGEYLEAGTNVQLHTDNGSNAQRWSITPTDNGYRIQSKCNSLYLDVADNKVADQTNVIVWSGNDNLGQRYGLVPYSPGIGQTIKDGTYQLKTALDKKSFAKVNSPNTNVQLATSGDRFKISYNGDGTYTIKETSSNGVFDVFTPTSADCIKPYTVTVQKSNSGRMQKWMIKKNSDGTYTFISQLNGNCLDVYDGATSSGNDIRVYFPNTSNAQKWILCPTITISFNANGGTVSTTSKTVDYDSTYGYMPTPTKTGYTFDGWYTSATDGTKITADTKVSITSNQTLYAHWKTAGYTVTFDANNGAVSTKSKSVELGKKYGTLPTPTLNGYTFQGWYTDKSSGTKITEDTVVTIAAAHTLYAHWTPNFTVTLNPNNGTVNPTSIVVIKGDIYRNLPTPTRTGYTFEGWYTSATGGTKITSDTKVTITANQTLYAHWNANKLTVRYNINGGSLGFASIGFYKLDENEDIHYYFDSYVTDIYEYDSAVNYVFDNANISTVDIEREGYTFLGWSTSKSGGKIINQNDTVLTLYPDLAKQSGTVVLYAVWGINKLTIQFNGNGGTLESDGNYFLNDDGDIYSKNTDRIIAATLNYDSWDTTNGLYNASTFKLSKEGYTFLGWSTSKTGGTIYDQDDTTLKTQMLYPNLAKQSGTITMYAQWKAIGDCNADGEFTIADAVMLQKWILAVKGAELTDWRAADLNEDGVINTFDLVMMKRMLISQK